MKNALLGLVLLALCVSALAAPSTLNNDDGCDISVAPAATLLLPYFEVDLASYALVDTLFSITNVTHLPRIASVTIWSDYAYPLFNFRVFLTGYDVQSISLYDVIALGRIPQGPGEPGQRSADNDDNGNLDLEGCDALPAGIPAATLASLRSALTFGCPSGQSCTSRDRIGRQHARAIGYVTVDVVRRCETALPSDGGYFIDHLLHDNVLIGDYQQVDRRNNFAQGNTLVHIRAVPELRSQPTNFARTFYSGLQNGGTADRRQPLPSTFAARWISGGVGAFNTSFKIWRERSPNPNAYCSSYYSSSCAFELTEYVRFDADENATVFTPEVIILVPPFFYVLPGAASRLRASDTNEFPPNPGGDLDGWMYMNLDDPYSLSVPPMQAWVVVSMEAEGRFSFDVDAAPLGNGCSPAVPVTAEDGSEPVIGPAPNFNGGS